MEERGPTPAGNGPNTRTPPGPANEAVADEAVAAPGENGPHTRTPPRADDDAAAESLLYDPHILNRVADAIVASGFAGDVTPAILVYLAITSRLLERPLNIALVAPSATGKNRAVDAAVSLMPAEAVYVLSASSPKALIYTPESFQHRTVVVSEADSLPDDGAAASAIRAIASDNRMVYEVVEQNPRTGKFGTRRIEREGPTGLVTTSTRSLPTQLGTRHLEVPVRDDPDQIRKVIMAHARAAMGMQAGSCDVDAFVALQRWLARVGRRRVVVPFAAVIAELVPATEARMNRDFLQLIACVQTMALLRQLQRCETPDGAVIAGMDDYREARKLLAPIFDAVAAEGVSATVRETVEAVEPWEEISQADLARKLRLGKSSISARVRRAIEGGWLVNRETRRGCPARLARELPLPEETSALPPVEEVERAFGCSPLFPGGVPLRPENRNT